MKKRIEKKVYEEHVVSQDTGEILTSKTIYSTQSEPDFVKLYIDCVFSVKGVRRGINPIFLALLEHMSYADMHDAHGGQIIYLNKALKLAIANKLGLKIDSINKAIYELVRAQILRRIDTGTYQVNANIVGRGEWQDIKNIRATIDFGAKEVVADIITNDDTDTNNAPVHTGASAALSGEEDDFDAKAKADTNRS